MCGRSAACSSRCSRAAAPSPATMSPTRLAAVLRAEPDWSQLPASLPSSGARARSQRCLEKDRTRPYCAISRLFCFALEGSPHSDAASTAAGVTGLSRFAHRRRHGRPPAWLAVAAAVSVGMARGPSRLPTPPIYFVLSYTSSGRRGVHGHVLPSMAFVSRQIRSSYTWRTSSSTCEPMAESGAHGRSRVASTQTNIGDSRRSPDGQSVAFWVRTGPPNPDSVCAVRSKSPRRKRPPFTLLPWTDSSTASAGKASGCVFGRRPACVRVRASGSPARTDRPSRRKPAGAETAVRQRRCGPVRRQTRPGHRNTQECGSGGDVVQSLTSPNVRRWAACSAARVLPTGHIVFVQRGCVMARAVRRSPEGDDRPTGSSAAKRSPAITGSPEALANRRWAAPISRLGHGRDGIRGWPTFRIVRRTEAGPRRSSCTLKRCRRRSEPTKRRVYRRMASSSLWDDARGTTAISIYESVRQLECAPPADARGNNRFPVWSVDGQRRPFSPIARRTSPSSGSSVDGSPPLERLTRRPRARRSHTAGVVSRWRRILFREAKGAENAVWSYSLISKDASPFGRITNPLHGARRCLARWALDPLHHQRGEQGGVSLQPFPATGAVFDVATPGRFPHWSPDGRQALFTSISQIWVVDVKTQGVVRLAIPVPLSTSGGQRPRSSLRLRRHARRPFPCHVHELGGSRTAEIQMVLNWFEELKA